MRVISGIKRGTNLYSPVTDKTRPTTDRVRENIFNLIRFSVPGARILDLFSGSGAMGIEALSQGGEFCVFVDSDKQAVDIIKKNIDKVSFGDRATVLKTPFDNYLKTASEGFDIVFLDPPYHKNLIDEAIKIIAERQLDNENCLFVLESDQDEVITLPDGYNIIREKIYGRVKVSLVRKELV